MKLSTMHIPVRGLGVVRVGGGEPFVALAVDRDTNRVRPSKLRVKKLRCKLPHRSRQIAALLDSLRNTHIEHRI